MAEITGRTQLVGLLGYPLEHTLSPRMQNAAFRARRLDWVYLPLRVRPEHLVEALKGLIALGFRGANVTIPHKEKALALLEEVSPQALALGAVNTIVVMEGRLRGENTDWLGFLRALEEAGAAHPSGRALVLGAGGAARAVVYALAASGWEATILNRTAQRAEALAEALASVIPEAKLSAGPLEVDRLEEELPRCRLLVNATSVGMHPQVNEWPLPEGVGIPPGIAVFDLVYNPPQTRLLEVARASGAKAIPGLGMLLHQGAEAFKLWTGREAPVEVMRDALSSRFRM